MPGKVRWQIRCKCFHGQYLQVLGCNMPRLHMPGGSQNFMLVLSGGKVRSSH